MQDAAYFAPETLIPAQYIPRLLGDGHDAERRDATFWWCAELDGARRGRHAVPLARRRRQRLFELSRRRARAARPGHRASAARSAASKYSTRPPAAQVPGVFIDVVSPDPPAARRARARAARRLRSLAPRAARSRISASARSTSATSSRSAARTAGRSPCWTCCTARASRRTPCRRRWSWRRCGPTGHPGWAPTRPHGTPRARGARRRAHRAQADLRSCRRRLVHVDHVAVARGQAHAFDFGRDLASFFPLDLEPGRINRLAVEVDVGELTVGEVDVQLMRLATLWDSKCVSAGGLGHASMR